MIILHSIKILEQLTKIETLIQKIEKSLEEQGTEADREKILKALVTSRMLEKN